jgi:hypothetical protein
MVKLLSLKGENKGEGGYMVSTKMLDMLNNAIEREIQVSIQYMW